MTERPSPAHFTPIHPNPYIVGNPVRGRAMFFGREAEFEMVRKNFQDAAVGGLMVFCGERRSGKTSILFQILDGRLGSDFIPVLIDMQSMAVGNEIEFLLRISEEIRAALGEVGESIPLPMFGADSTHSATFQKFIRQVLKKLPTKKLILLFDEYELFENKIDAGLLSPDVLNMLANLIENHPVFMVFTGSQYLEQRRRDYWRLLARSHHKMISYLAREDALRLVRQPVEGKVDHGPGVVDSIWRLAAGQPFYTQAICQSLVDHLNERRTNEATLETLADVVDGIVNNPLPQMIFLWDGLEPDDKLVLALLAEQLVDERGHASSDDLMKHLRRRQYPLDLEEPRVATTLEKLYKSEFLLRKDSGNVRAYAFRMDLWRQWIRRQHVVWQVMREVGLEIRPDSARRLRRTLVTLGAVIPVLGVTLLAFSTSRHRDNGRPPSPPVTESATFGFVVSPSNASISVDGQSAGFGNVHQSLDAERPHVFRFSAAGYADSTMSANLAPGASNTWNVQLRERLGDLRVVTHPAGAQVRVDGAPAGTSPLVVRGLSSARSHDLWATLEGHGEARKTVTVGPDTTSSVTLALQQETATVLIATEPSGSAIRLDNKFSGTSPWSVALDLGRHGIAVSRSGYVKAETTLTVTKQTGPLQITLLPEPLGILVIKGNKPGDMWIDGGLVVSNVPNSGKQKLPPGSHTIRVVFPNGNTLERQVSIHSGERTTYDYSNGTLESVPEGRP